MKYAKLKISDCRPNTWNPNVQSDDMYRHTKASIEKLGFVDPITVREIDGEYEIIDGEYRWQAAGDLGYEEIDAINLGVVTDEVGKQLTLALNNIHGEDDTELLKALLTELEEELGADHLTAVLPYSQEELEALLAGIVAPEPQTNWVTYTFRVPIEAQGIVDSEFDRIGSLLELNADLDERVRAGLILEKICVLSADTPTESLL